MPLQRADWRMLATPHPAESWRTCGYRRETSWRIGLEAPRPVQTGRDGVAESRVSEARAGKDAAPAAFAIFRPKSPGPASLGGHAGTDHLRPARTAEVDAQFGPVVDALLGKIPAATRLPDAHDDLLAFTAEPREIWRQAWSSNPKERLNRELRRRAGGAGIFPGGEAVTRLAGAVFLEQNDEWTEARRYMGPGGGLWPGASSAEGAARRGRCAPRSASPRRADLPSVTGPATVPFRLRPCSPGR